MIELDEKSLLVLGQMVREVGKEKVEKDETTHDLMLGKFMVKVINHLNNESMRNLREEQNK